MRILIPVFFLVLLCAPTAPAFAAVSATSTPIHASSIPSQASSTSSQEQVHGIERPGPRPAGLSSCFDHYRFGSVQANVSPSLSSTVPGAVIAFSGTLTNENAYPVPAVVVYAKIFRSRGTEKNVNGNDVVAFFPAIQPVNLKAHESKPLTFTWKVPADAEPGDYLLATDVVSSDRFELSGLVFTDDVIGTSANFSVKANDNGAIRFNKDSVSAGGKPFFFAAFPPTIPPGVGAVPLTAKVKNSTNAPFQGTVTWNVYYWDSVGKSHLLDTQKQEVKVHPNSSSDAGVTVTDTAHAVYYVLGTFMTAQGSESTIGIRFTRAGVNEPRLNFVAVDQGTAVACMHSTGVAPAEGGHVDITVVGNTWWQKLLSAVGIGTLAHASYDGSISGEIYALTAPLKHNSSSYSITANISQNGKHIDTVTVNYSCADLASSCKEGEFVSIVIALILLLVIIGGALIIRRRMHYPSIATTTK